uniref:Uncharacterized protein n=1 Tax=Pseudomonas phage HRDY3 TaxID=3236930 RepID=A0AB39CDM5_9VIRU
MKYPEFIGAIRRTVLRDVPALGLGGKGFVKVDWDQFSNLVKRGFIIGQREDLDESLHWGESFKGNRDYAQWLNYFSVEQAGTPVHLPELNPYMRAREGNGESYLLGRGSCMPGGHLDAIDVRYEKDANGRRTSIPDLLLTSLQNIMREAFEEMTFSINGEAFQAWEPDGFGGEYLSADLHDLANLATLHFEGIIFDNSDNVGRLHLAIAWRLRLREGVTVGNREKGVDFIPPVAASKLYETYPGVTFENWTNLFVEHLNGLTPESEISRNYLDAYVLPEDDE